MMVTPRPVSESSHELDAAAAVSGRTPMRPHATRAPEGSCTTTARPATGIERSRV